jgi:ATP-binding cassette subfamily F protein uup
VVDPEAVAPDAAPKADRTGMSAGDLRAARKELSRLERQVGKLEEREARLNESLAEHGSDYEKIVELEARLKAVRAERAQVEEAWLELADRIPEG